MTLAFWLILATVLIYGLLHSLLASLPVKGFIHRRLGPRSSRWYRLAFNFLAVITFLPVLGLLVILPEKKVYQLPFPWDLISLTLQLLALVALLAGLRQTGITSFLGLQQYFTGNPGRPHRLVTGGRYRYVRHPLYSAGLAFIWLLPVLTWDMLAVNLGFTIYILLGIQLEERKLLLEYGEAYAVYRRRTPMLIPGIRHIQLSHRSPES